MLNFSDAAAAIDEPKTARMEKRTKPSIKAQIQKAAALLGVDETTFVTSAALERARATIADQERTLLSAEACSSGCLLSLIIQVWGAFIPELASACN